MATEMGKRLLSSRKSKDVPIPGIGTVTVRQLNATDLLAMMDWTNAISKTDPDTPLLICLARAVTYSCFDETGDRVFDPDDYVQVASDVDAGVFAELGALVREFNPSLFPPVDKNPPAKEPDKDTRTPEGNGAASPPGAGSPTDSQENSDSSTSM